MNYRMIMPENMERYFLKYKSYIAVALLSSFLTWSSCSFSSSKSNKDIPEPVPKELVVKAIKEREYPIAGITMSTGKKHVFIGQKDGSYRNIDDMFDEQENNSRIEQMREKSSLEDELGLK